MGNYTQPLSNSIDRRLAILGNANRLRTLVPTRRLSGAQIEVNGGIMTDLSSNDYLGLADSGRCAPRFSGATGSRLLGGNRPETMAFEDRFATWLGYESGLLFNSGYHANVGVLSTVVGPEDLIIADRLCHASIWDGIRLSGAKWVRFRHNDATHCEHIIQKHLGAYRTILVVTEAVFSMDGDRAVVSELVDLKRRYPIGIMVDESHSVGVLGPEGRGMISQLGCVNDVDIWMAGLGKAWAGVGAMVCGSHSMIQLLISSARPFIYSTALPLSAIAWADWVLSQMPTLDLQRQRLSDLTHRLGGLSHIVPVQCGDVQAAQQCADYFKHHGFWAPVIKPPTVPEGQCRLRLSLSASIPDAEICVLTQLLDDWRDQRH